MRKYIFALLLVFNAILSNAQITLSGHTTVNSAGDSDHGQASIVMTDADCNVITPAGACTVSSGDGPFRGTFLVTSSASFTASRNIVIPLSPGRVIYVENATTGGQLLCVKGSTGNSACIPSGQMGPVVSDGTNVVLASSTTLLGKSITMSDLDYTLSASDSLYSFLSFSGTLTAIRSIFAPATLGLGFTVTNTTAQTLWFHTSSGGTGVFILAGQTKIIRYNGTGYVEPPITNPFLSSFDLANCSTLYIFPVGISGTTANNQCASQASSNRNATIIGSPTVSQYGLVLNPNGTTGQALQLPTSENAWKTMFIAGYFPNWGTSLGVSWGDSFSFSPNGSILGGTNANLTTLVDWNPAQQPGHSADSLYSFRPTGHVNAMMKPIPLGWHVIGLVCDTGGGTAQYYVDGVAYPMSASNVTTCPTSTSTGNQQIGGTSLLTLTWKTMVLTGAEIYYTPQSPATIYKKSQAWLNYIKTNVQQPQNEQYSATNSAPVVMICCDSRTQGSAAPPGPSAYMVLDDTSAQIRVSASSGTTLYDVCTANSMPDSGGAFSDLSNPMAAKVAIIVWAGVNDFTHGNYITTNGAAYYSCVARTLRRLNPNATLFLATEIDACGPSDITQKNATNPYVLNQAYAWGYNGGIINLNSAARLGADNACANTTYFLANSPHQSDFANQTIVSPIWSNAINEAWGSNTQNWNVHDSSSGTSYTELARDGALRLTGSLPQTISLPDCQGYSHIRTIWNDSSVTSTLLPGVTGMGSSFTQLISGQSSISLPTNSSTEVEPIPGPSSTGTCTYRLKSQTPVNYSLGGTISSCSVTAAAGAGASCTVTGLDSTHRIVLTLGTSGVTTGIVANITFSTPRGHAVYPLMFQSNSATSLVSQYFESVDSGTGTGYSVLLDNASVTPGTYAWNVTAP